ncbi:PA domain-containing protein [Histoplasma capsulatum]|uniref:RING-type E3 ubiquitin transferase n=1 Tax=Ajellomyces capsulatus TaxID=5037 RepID=A0A8A1MA86_AJECA|nr:predicted protein [Histoplasma mississippiense (nom. inval.)]EDN08869.1 predicted protein [Histoplasma mississippiense (nom. inval.)]QSS63468.1 PA domain-containing protein [Histoplasma capsulatum]
MRPPRLILLLACFIFLPIFLTILSLLFSHPQHGSASQSSVSGGAGRLRALFSFHAPSSLFPPSAMISLTDDNSTFFLARPAAFGPTLPSSGLSGQLWIGSGFGDDVLRKGGVSTGAEGELGCSDVPGWEDNDKNQNHDVGSGQGTAKLTSGIKKKNTANKPVKALNERRDEHSSDLVGFSDQTNHPSKEDGTDDHLHHPLPASGPPGLPSAAKGKEPAHADIQSLQESAEIRGKIVLLSRGGCGFLEKVKWAQRRGGIALVVGDDTRGGGLVTMYARGDTSNITIPAIFTSHTTAHLLSSLIPSETQSDPSSAKDQSKATFVGKPADIENSRKPATATHVATQPTKMADSKSYTPSKGFFQSLFSAIGLGRDKASTWQLQEDSRRPPSSGNIDWVMQNEFDDEETSPKSRKPTPNNMRKENGDDISLESHQGGSDDFVIGVQDWRDPDLVAPPKTNNPPQTTLKPKSSNVKQKDDQAGVLGGDNTNGPGGSGLKGGSITPGSGEYSSQDKSAVDKGTGRDPSTPPGAADSRYGNSKQDSHWWSGWGKTSDDDQISTSSNDRDKGQQNMNVKETSTPLQKSSKERGKHPEHEGLWVTLTPTSMSTSPFFDTLLVLVVSPLITLTVVYALLLLRSRIRRRRWRAPKAVVDRLPVRTYHSIPSGSPSSTSSQTATSPEASSASSPLLSHSRARSPRPRPRSQTTAGIVASSSHDATNDSSTNAEKSNSDSSLWRRRYTGRQVECVVCLEEYIDGQSRVMSLPCGHEFHAECITPWLTTRRRTCPICKGDVVRSMGGPSSSDQTLEGPERMSEDLQARIAETRNDSPSAAVPISNVSGFINSDLERGDDSRVSLLNRAEAPNPQSSWRNLASLSISALNGDSVWHQSRSPRSDRNR